MTSCHPVTHSVKFDDFEHVTCMKVVSLRSAETVSGKKHFVVVSTCDLKTEEVSSKGKVGREMGGEVSSKGKVGREMGGEVSSKGKVGREMGGR